jgi:hypothetical protein
MTQPGITFARLGMCLAKAGGNLDKAEALSHQHYPGEPDLHWGLNELQINREIEMSDQLTFEEWIGGCKVLLIADEFEGADEWVDQYMTVLRTLYERGYTPKEVAAIKSDKSEKGKLVSDLLEKAKELDQLLASYKTTKAIKAAKKP